MMEIDNSKPALSFPEVNVFNDELWKVDLRIKLQTRHFRLLAAWLEEPGEVVPREELQRKV